MEKIAIDFKLFIGGSKSLTQYFLSVVLSVLRGSKYKKATHKAYRFKPSLSILTLKLISSPVLTSASLMYVNICAS